MAVVDMAAGVYPTSGNDFDALAAAMDRLCLTDASIGVKRENSDALGAGFRCGCGMGPGALQYHSMHTHSKYCPNCRLPARKLYVLQFHMLFNSCKRISGSVVGACACAYKNAAGLLPLPCPSRVEFGGEPGAVFQLPFDFQA